MALTPFSGSIPACAALPIAFSANLPIPLRAVFNAPPGSDGSSTKTARHGLASDSVTVREEVLPTSSSLTSKTVTHLGRPRSTF